MLRFGGEMFTAGSAIFRAAGAMVRYCGAMVRAGGTMFKAGGEILRSVGAMVRAGGTMFKAGGEILRSVGAMVRAGGISKVRFVEKRVCGECMVPSQTGTQYKKLFNMMRRYGSEIYKHVFINIFGSRERV